MLGLRATESHTHAKEMTVKVKQVVETEFARFSIGWSNIEFTDVHDNRISIEITDDQILMLSDRIAEKAAKIRQKREDEREEVNNE